MTMRRAALAIVLVMICGLIPASAPAQLVSDIPESLYALRPISSYDAFLRKFVTKFKPAPPETIRFPGIWRAVVQYGGRSITVVCAFRSDGTVGRSEYVNGQLVSTAYGRWSYAKQYTYNFGYTYVGGQAYCNGRMSITWQDGSLEVGSVSLVNDNVYRYACVSSSDPSLVGLRTLFFRSAP
jgi:hypothetical protein